MCCCHRQLSAALVSSRVGICVSAISRFAFCSSSEKSTTSTVAHTRYARISVEVPSACEKRFDEGNFISKECTLYAPWTCPHRMSTCTSSIKSIHSVGISTFHHGSGRTSIRRTQNAAAERVNVARNGAENYKLQATEHEPNHNSFGTTRSPFLQVGLNESRQREWGDGIRWKIESTEFRLLFWLIHQVQIQFFLSNLFLTSRPPRMN